MDKEIHTFIYQLRKRLAIQKAINIFPFVLLIGFFIGFLHLLFGYFYPFYYAEILAVLWIFASVLFGICFFFFHFPKEQEAAHIGDTVIGQERLLTSLELRGKDDPIFCLQKEDTIAHLSVCNIKESFPYKLHFKQLLLCIFMASFFFLLLYLPSKAKLEAEKLHALKQDVKKELTLLDDIKKEIAKEKISEKQSPSALETTEEKRKNDNNFDNIKELLEQAKKEYSSADSKQELQKAKERLRVKLENMAEKETSKKKQTEISDLIEQMGFPASYDINNANESETSLSENNAASSENASNASNNKNDENTKAKSENGTNSNKNNDKEANSSSNGKNNHSNNNNNSNENQNNDKNHSNDDTDKKSLDSDSSASNQSKDQETGNHTGESNTGNQPSEKQQENNSYSNPGKNHGSKKGIERKKKQKEIKEKIMITSELTSKDENLTGTISKDGNSYQESSKKQLAFGKKEDLEKVEKEYAQEALTTINNHSIPEQMKEIVQSYFNQINREE